MYHSIVRRRIISLFDAINRGDASPVSQGFAKDFDHLLLGQRALSSRRRDLALVTERYVRLFRLMPELHFTIPRISVKGLP